MKKLLPVKYIRPAHCVARHKAVTAVHRAVAAKRTKAMKLKVG